MNDPPTSGTRARRLAHAELRQRTVSSLAINALVALAIIAFSLLAGVAGYHWLAPMSWMDAFMNAAMLLGGVGPVTPLDNDPAKFFAGVYALYCGVVFIATAGLLIAPIGAHILHRFHLDRAEK